MIDKDKAVLLRKQGLTYAEIAKEVGCSLIWCKKNLNTTVKNTKEKDTISVLTKKARSDHGLTAGEILSELEKTKEEPMLESKPTKRELKEQDVKLMRRIKTKVKEQSGTVIRPYWMKPTEAKKALKLVIQAVNLIDARLYEEVQHIMQELDLDESYIKSLTRTIAQMTYGGSLLIPNNIRELCDSLSKTADELEKRNKP